MSDLPEAFREIGDARRRQFAWEYVFNGAQGAAAAKAAGGGLNSTVTNEGGAQGLAPQNTTGRSLLG